AELRLRPASPPQPRPAHTAGACPSTPSARRANPSWTVAVRTPPLEEPPAASGSPTAWLLHRPWTAKASTPLSHQFLSRLPCQPPLNRSSTSVVLGSLGAPLRPKSCHQGSSRPRLRFCGLRPRNPPSGRPREISCTPPQPNRVRREALACTSSWGVRTREATEPAYSSLDPAPPDEPASGPVRDKVRSRSPYILFQPARKGSARKAFACHPA